MSRIPSQPTSENFGHIPDAETVDVVGQREGFAQLESDTEIDIVPDNEVDLGVHISDEEATNEKGETFMSYINRLEDKGVNMNADEFVKNFLFWIESGEDFDKNKRKQEEERYERWIESVNKKDPSWLDTVWGDFKKSSLWRYGKSKSRFGSERALSALLSKKASEIAAAWLPLDKLASTFEKSCQNGFVTEARACLLTLAHRGVLSEKNIEFYYKSFGVKNESTPVVSGVDSNGVGIPVYDENNKPVTVESYSMGKLDNWLEGYIRREAATRGGRPDTFSSGRRVMGIDPSTGEEVTLIKSADWQARATDEDILDMGSRRGNVAMATHITNFIETADQAKAIEALLARKRDEAPKKIEQKLAKIREIETGLTEYGLPAERKEMLKKEKDWLELSIRDERLRAELIGEKLKVGVKYDEKDPEFKSFLLDPTDYTTEIEVDGKKFKEAELAVELTVRKYWQARDEHDAQRMITGRDIKGIEKQTYIKLMSDKFRDEFTWSSGHHIFGTRLNGKYDETRDGPGKMLEYMDGELTRKKSKEFSYETRNFYYDEKAGEGMGDIIAYDKSNMDNSVIKRIKKDDPLYPKNHAERARFNISEIIRDKKEQWDALPNEDGPEYAVGRLGSVYKTETNPDEVSSYDTTMSVFKEGLGAARRMLIDTGDYKSLDRTRDKFLKYRKHIHEYLDKVENLETEDEDAINEALAKTIEQLGEDKLINIEDVLNNLPDNKLNLKNEPDLKDKLNLAINRLNEAEIKPYWEALRNIEILNQEFNQANDLSDELIDSSDNLYEDYRDLRVKTANISEFTNECLYDKRKPENGPPVFSSDDIALHNKMSGTQIDKINSLGLNIDTNQSTHDVFEEVLKQEFILKMEMALIAQKEDIDDEDEDDEEEEHH